jgi:hypothetical protein
VTDRMRRFLGLERRRRDTAHEEQPKTGGRFGAVEGPATAIPIDTVPEDAADRFRAPQERLPDVERSREGEQPFVRCSRCEVDNTVYAATCLNCQADLGTPEQRAFNEKLWASRKVEASREAEELAERRQEQERAGAEEQRLRRAMAEEMAREVGERERRRLDGENPAWGWSSGGRPLGLRLLERISDERLRAAILGAVVAILVLIALLGARRVALGLFMLIVLLFVPSRRSGRWRF